jgi:hypothetical protein
MSFQSGGPKYNTALILRNWTELVFSTVTELPPFNVRFYTLKNKMHLPQNETINRIEQTLSVPFLFIISFEAQEKHNSQNRNRTPEAINCQVRI